MQCKNMNSYCSVNTIEEVKPFSICPPVDIRVEDFARKITEDCCYLCNNTRKQHAQSIPLVITRKNRGETMAILPWSALKELLRSENTRDS